MSGLFDNRPMDDDTRILTSQPATIDGLDVLLEAWIWDGIAGQSVILLESQLPDHDDEQVVARVRNALQISGKTTVARKGEGFIFVNYHFNVL